MNGTGSIAPDAAAVAVEVHLEVQVRPGRVAAGADDADLLAGGDRLADRDLRALHHVAVAGDDALPACRMSTYQPQPGCGRRAVAVAAVRRCACRCRSARRSPDRRPRRGCRRSRAATEVDAVWSGRCDGAEAGDRRTP